MNFVKTKTYPTCPAVLRSKLCFGAGVVNWYGVKSPSCFVRIFISLLIFAGVFGVTGKAWANNWYVDNSVASSGSGQSWETAWKDLSDVVWGLSGVNAGDTLFISGGVTQKIYQDTMTVGADGFSDNPITIRVGQDVGHNGTVILDYEYLGEMVDINAISVNGRDNIVIDGSVNGEPHLYIRNLANYLTRYQAIGIYGNGVNNITVKHVKFSNINNAVKLTSSAGAEIHNNVMEGIRGDGAVMITESVIGWDVNKIYNNSVEILINKQAPPGQEGNFYSGADGVQGGGSLSIYNNTFRIRKTTDVYTSTQHPDTLQVPGNYLKIYNNEFINIGDCAVSPGSWGENEARHDILIYNNIFRIVDDIDPYPEYIRFYNNSHDILSIDNFKILNNTFVDNRDFTNIRISNFGNPTGTGNEIKNNIFYNSGNGTFRQSIVIGNSINFTDESWDIDGNIYYSPDDQAYITYRDVTYPASEWVANYEPHGSLGQPSFVSYSPKSPDNDFHLLQNDLVAKDRGLDLSPVFQIDFDNISRPQGSGWDIGAYEYQQVTSPRADVDNSSAITTTDALLTLRNSLGLSMNGTAWQASATTGDVNCDGNSNSTDALLILRYSLGLGMSETGWCE